MLIPFTGSKGKIIHVCKEENGLPPVFVSGSEVYMDHAGWTVPVTYCPYCGCNVKTEVSGFPLNNEELQKLTADAPLTLFCRDAERDEVLSIAVHILEQHGINAHFIEYWHSRASTCWSTQDVLTKTEDRYVLSYEAVGQILLGCEDDIRADMAMAGSESLDTAIWDYVLEQGLKAIDEDDDEAA